MKCLGLIGGIGWESTAIYYRLINEDLRLRFGSFQSARLILNSLSFDPIDTMLRTGRWEELAATLAEAAQTLERAGADAIVLCSIQLHHVATQVQEAVGVPLLHVGSAIGNSLGRTRDNVGLIGASCTLAQGFLLEPRSDYLHFRKRRVHLLPEAERARLDDIIQDELARGMIRPESAQEVLRMAKDLRANGARRVVLAASELSLLFRLTEPPVWLDDGTELHAAAALRWAVGELRGPTEHVRPAGSIRAEPLGSEVLVG